MLAQDDVTGPLQPVWATLVGGPSNTLHSAHIHRTTERAIPPRIPGARQKGSVLCISSCEIAKQWLWKNRCR
jgi:hypothetical protein